MTPVLKIWICLLAANVLYASTREMKAVRSQAPITVDGYISLLEWPSALFQSAFIQMEPSKGKPSGEITQVAVQFDEKNLYVAFKCGKSYPEPVVARQTRRDQIEKKDDVVAVSLDTYHDLRSAYWFMTNGLNTQVDMRISDDGKYIDEVWDAGWKVKTAISDTGWTAEFAIPFQALRFDPNQTGWGVNFGRFIPKTLETSYWSGRTDNDFRVSQYGLLTGLEFPGASLEIHIIPYGTARYESFSVQHWNGETGGDLEFKHRNNLTGNVTVNPDFATVEGDRERINMTRWELSFPEKRKFFLEGSEMFQNRIQAFYTRRIGEIDYGGKMVGRFGPYAFSVMGVRARSVDDNPATSSDESFPSSHTSVVRMKRDVLKSSTIGLLFVNKGWNEGHNRVLSLDGVFHFPYDLHFTTQLVVAGPGPFSRNFGGFVRLARETNIYHYHLRYTELGEDFKESANGIGYIIDDNRRELDSAINYKWWIRKLGIEYIDYGSNYNIYWSRSSGILRSWEILQELQCYLKNKLSLGVDFVRDYQLFEKGFNNYSWELDLGYNAEEWSYTELGYQFGHNFDLDFWMLTWEIRFKLSRKMSVEYELRKLQYSPDPDLESTWLSIATIGFQFTPDLYLRLFTQYRSATERLYVYGLFGWRFKLPNSAVYFVYTRDDFDRPGLTREKNEVVFLKLAYDFVL